MKKKKISLLLIPILAMSMCVNTYAGTDCGWTVSSSLNEAYSHSGVAPEAYGHSGWSYSWGGPLDSSIIDQVLLDAPSKLTVKKGKSCKMGAAIIQSPYRTEKITYTSANKKIATVDKNGKITGKKKGTTKITVKVGNKKATTKVTVK